MKEAQRNVDLTFADFYVPTNFLYAAIRALCMCQEEETPKKRPEKLGLSIKISRIKKNGFTLVQCLQILSPN